MFLNYIKRQSDSSGQNRNPKNAQILKPKSVIRNFCEQNVRQQPLLWPKFTLHTLIIAIIMAYFTQNGSPIF